MDGTTADNLIVIDPQDGVGRRADIVFLHGLNGTAESTWVGADGEMWVYLLQQAFPWARLILPTYITKRMFFDQQRGLKTFPDLGMALLDDLTARAVGEVPLIFVAHSAGGPVAIEILKASSNSRTKAHRALIKATVGVIFIACPLRGAPAAGLAVSTPVVGAVLRGLVGSTVLELSDRNPANLDRVEWFRDVACGAYAIGARAFAEDAPLVGGLCLVPRGYADPELAGRNVVPVARNHFNIAHVHSATDGVFPSVVRDIRAWLSDADTLRPEISTETLQSLAGHLLSAGGRIEGRLAFCRDLRAIAEELAIKGMQCEPLPDFGVKVTVLERWHAVTLGLLDLKTFFGDEISLRIIGLSA